MAIPQWEYCLLTFTPMTGLDGEGVRFSYQVVSAGGTEHRQMHSDSTSPLAALGLLLNELGAEGWELVTYDTTTNRGVFKRPGPGLGGER
jgi:hypothetical protein